MMRFTSLLDAGLRFAFMSDKSDGDCSSRPEMRGHVEALFYKAGCRPEKVVRVRQVHGIRIMEANGALYEGDGNSEEADGVFTNEPGLALGISVADCAPVLLYDPDARAVAALHAGREGTFNNIADAGVRALSARFGCAPAVLRAVIGPCAGPCCYEVSPEQAQKWQAAGLPGCGRYLHLAEANRMQLENAGLFRHNIYVVPHCTVCGGLFFSYRAGEISNRNLVVVML